MSNFSTAIVMTGTGLYYTNFSINGPPTKCVYTLYLYTCNIMSDTTTRRSQCRYTWVKVSIRICFSSSPIRILNNILKQVPGQSISFTFPKDLYLKSNTYYKYYSNIFSFYSVCICNLITKIKKKKKNNENSRSP